MSTVDIKKKCPNGENGGHVTEECNRYSRLTASLRNVNGKEYPHYRVCKHAGDRIANIRYLKYAEKDLTIAGGPLLTRQHPKIKEVFTYYTATYDSGDWDINIPLALRLKDGDGSYHWYENKGNPLNTEWENIPGGEKDFFIGYNPTEKLKEKLNQLTCQLHKLHYVNINAITNYNCLCNITSVDVQNEGEIVSGYIRYKHDYGTGANFVRHKDVVLELRDDDKCDPIPLDKVIHNLTVYYWDQDREHKRPLLMEVAIGELWDAKVPVGNNGKPDNSDWTIITDNDEFKLTDQELEKKLKEQKCKLIKPVVIDVSKAGGYPNPYCKNEECKNGECPKNVQVNTYSVPLPLGYTARKHTYENGEPFTITNFIGGPSLDEKKLPIWNVREVVVFFAKCQKDANGVTKTPLLVYVGSDDGKTHKWYNRAKKDNGANRWEEVEGDLKDKDPQTASKGDYLGSTLKEIKGKLKIECQGEKEKQLKGAEQGKEVEKEEAKKGRNKTQLPPSLTSADAAKSAGEDEDPDQKLFKAISKVAGKVAASVIAESGIVGFTAVNAALKWVNKVLVQQALQQHIPDSPGTSGSRDNTGPPYTAHTAYQHLLGEEGEYGIPLSIKGATLPVKGSNAPLSLPGAEGGSRPAASPDLIGGYAPELLPGLGGVTTFPTTEQTTPQASQLPRPILTAVTETFELPQTQQAPSQTEESSPESAAPEKLVDGVSGGILTVLIGAGTYGGPIAGAGGLTGLGWWIYNRYKGDPWVRQI